MISETFTPVDDNLDFGASFSDIRLLHATRNARIYHAIRAGKRLILKTAPDDSARQLDLLKREYLLAVALDHPNVAGVYSWAPDTPVGPAIVMEYVDGRTLADFLAERPSRAARRRVFAQILDAVEYIHKHAVTHNDLKSTNILVSRAYNNVKIIDFGLSDDDSQTSQRLLGGTPGYASPELCARDGSTDARSDIYSLGVILGEMFPGDFRLIRRRCLAQDPNRRYANVEALRRAWMRRRRLPFIGAAAIILAIIAASFLLTARHFTTRQNAYADSIVRLNQQIALRDHEKSLEDSLTNQYFDLGHRIIDQYCDDLRDLGYMEANIYLNPRFIAAIDSLETGFIAQNGDLGIKIAQLYTSTIRAEGIAAAQSVVNELPLLLNVVPDKTEYEHYLSLITSGKKIKIRKPI